MGLGENKQEPCGCLYYINNMYLYKIKKPNDCILNISAASWVVYQGLTLWVAQWNPGMDYAQDWSEEISH